MKQAKERKNRLWLWIALAAVVVAVGVVAALVLPGILGGQSQGSVGDADLYWNIDKIKYTENAEVMGMSTREPAEDGNFYVRFAHQGEQVELQVVDKQLVNVIDNLDAMGLTFNADGVVVDAIPAAQLATPMAKDFYVRAVNGNQVVMNSSIAMNGMDVRFEITDKTGIWDVDLDTDPIGKVCELNVFDRVHVYANAEGVVTHVYMVEHPVDAEIYWRVERMYDAETGQHTRVPDENGVYTILCSHKGELVELKCKDADLVREIDEGAILQAQFAFVLDEEGYIIESVDVGMALRGTYYASDYHVTEVIDENNYTLTKLSAGNSQGDVKSLKLAENCVIYQCCQQGCYEKNCGEIVDSLQEYDRVNVYSDLDGNAIMIFVTRRKVDSKMYYNLNRSYNATKQTTTRKLEGGYYVYDMLVDGKVIKVKTNNKEFADKIDARSNQCCGLDLDGNIITAVHDPVCVAGSAALGNKSPLTAMMGSVITVSDPYSGKSWNSVLAADCKVYSAVQGIYGKEVGGETTLQVGDHVTTWRNSHEEIYLAFVTSRRVEGAKIYYNLDRRYNAEAKQTRREPNEEGYYEFLMATEGKQVTVKTQSRSLATFMDSQTAPVMGLKVNKNGIVTGACEVAMAVPNGAKSCNYHYVKNLNSAAGTFSTYYIEDNVKHDSSIAQQKIAKNCKIWNVSQAYEKYRGERSTLKNGDQIQGIIDVTTGEMIMIFIMNRDPIAGFKSYNAFCKHCNKTVTWEPYAGGQYVEKDTHYYACSPYVLRQGIIGREDDGKVFDVVIDLKGKNITTMGRSLLVYDKLTIMDSVGGGKIAGTTPTETGSLTTGGTVMVLSGGELNLMGGELTRSEQSTASGRIGGILYVGEKCTVNMTGGKITGGSSTEQGGNIYTNGVLNISGGTISGGNAAVGANIMVAVGGSVNMSGGKVDGDFYMVSGTKATLSGAPVISGTGIQVPAGGTISVAGLRSGASIVVDADGIFTEELTNPSSYLPYFTAARQVDKIQVEGNALNYIKKRENYNGVNNGNLAFTSGSTAYCPVCKKDVAWTKLTADAITLAEGHYYLDSDITYSGSEEAYITGPALSKTACVHLNGHNITATTGRAIEAKAGVLNVMGNGTVSGSYNDNRLFGATINMNGGNGILNLVGGTYTKNEDCKVSSVVLIRNGDVYMYDGAEIISNANSNQCPNVQVFNRCFHLYGGKISGGTGLQVAANNWSPTVSGVVNVHGGEIVGTVMASGVGTKYGTLNVTGGKIVGYVLVNRYVNATFSGGAVEGTVSIDSKATNANSAVKVSGTAVITENGLVIPEDYKISVGRFSSGAMIRVKANGVFTEALDNANAAKAYFEPVRLIDEIIVENKALAYVKHDKDLNTIDNSNLTLSGNKAMCPACGSEVVWTKLTADAITLAGNKHYYLDSDINYTGAEVAYITGPASGQTACVHLNGHNITATAYRAIEVKAGTLNIMGNGTVSGAYNANRLFGATISTSGVNGVLNLIGGKYTKADSCNTSPVILLRNGDVNMYNGAEVYSTVNSNTLPNIMVYTNSFNLFGGKIHGGSGAQLSAANWSPTVSGIINIHGGEVAGTMVISGAETAHSTFTMDGGVVKGYVQLSRFVDAGISGGTFTGTLSIDSKATNENSYIVFGGKPVISGSLTIPAGYKIVLAELTTGADIRVAATGAFTDALPNANDLVGYFKPARGVDEIQVIDNALTYVRKEIDLNAVNNDDLVFTDNKATCPTCGDSVAWIKLTDAATTLEGGKHYYLDGDITYAGTDVAYITGPGANQTACVHLNGHNITASAFRAIEAKEGVLNVMGNGTVSGAGNVKNYGATVNAGGVNGVLNLIGGTYTKADSCNTSPVVLLRGGDANMYNGATVYSTVNSNTLPNVMVFTNSFNLYGGKIHGGTGAQLSSANWSKSASGKIVIHGGEVAGTMVISGADGVHGSFTMDGGIVSGYIQLSRYVDSVISGGTISGTAEAPSNATVDNSSITISGNAKITGSLKLPADYKINVGQLEDDASVVVSASGVFTKDITDATAAQAHFLPARAIDEIVVDGNALRYKKNDVDLTTVSNADLVFTNNKAVCPACGDPVTWTKLTASAITLEDGKHYYLDGDITYTGTDAAYITGPAAGMKACVHLNGHNITATAYRAIEAKEGILNVMGNGTVSGAYNANRLFGATVNHSGVGGTLNLIGGTYTKAESCNVSPVVLLRGGDVNVYNAQINSTVNSASLPNVRVFTNTFTMYGGKVSGGTGAQIAAANWSSSTSGKVVIHGGEVSGMLLMSAANSAHGQLTVDGGTVTGYVELGRFVDTVISGGTFTNTVTMGANAANDNSSVTLSGNAKITGSLKLPEGYKITLGELTAEASVNIKATGVFTAANEKASQYAAYFHPESGYEVVAENNQLAVKAVTNP